MFERGKYFCEAEKEALKERICESVSRAQKRERLRSRHFLFGHASTSKYFCEAEKEALKERICESVFRAQEKGATHIKTEDEGKKMNMKKKIIIPICSIIAILLLLLAVMLYRHFSPSTERMSLYKYFNVDKEQVEVVLGDRILVIRKVF